MFNLKKNKFLFVIITIFILLSITYVLLPSKSSVKEIKIKTATKEDITIKIQAFKVDSSELKEYDLFLKDDVYSNLLKYAIEDMVSKYNESKSRNLKLLNLYFGDNIVYYEFDGYKEDSLFFEAVLRMTKSIVGLEKIEIIQ